MFTESGKNLIFDKDEMTMIQRKRKIKRKKKSKGYRKIYGFDPKKIKWAYNFLGLLLYIRIGRVLNFFFYNKI